MRYLLFLPVLIGLACNRSFSQQPLLLPTLSVETDSGKTALQIQKLDIRVAVTGNIASTTYDITFYNPFDRVLEGSFEFPLAEGQSINRYGLDINGIMREGVVVEKQQARVAYENTVRRNVDPGLVEKTKGNSYRTRIYPIPAKGYKRVLIGVEQAMQYLDEELLYHLPVKSAMEVESLSVQAIVYNSVHPETKGNTPASFTFSGKGNDWSASYNRRSFIPDMEIKFAIPFNAESPIMSFTGEHKGNTYFYLALPLQQEYIEKKAPSVLTVLWDISSSAKNRNIEKELTLLKDYISELGNATITLIPFNNALGKPEIFAITDGNAAALIQRVRGFDYDGGTQLGSINLANEKSEQVLLFTDGLGTFGKKEITTGAVPVAVISSSATADHDYMKWVAKQTNGIYVNLENINNEEALRSLIHTPLQFIGAVHGGGIQELYSSAASSRSGLSLAGILKTPSATITLNFGYGNTVVTSTTYTISKDEDPIPTVARSWAALKIEELEMRPKKNREMITQLGKEFSVVTSNTSLLVLDRAEDYAQYEITPPAELRPRYDSLMKEKMAITATEKQAPIQGSLEVMKELKKWYLASYSKKYQPALKPVTNANGYASAERHLMANRASAANATYDANLSLNTVYDSTTMTRTDIGTVSMSADDDKLEEVVVTREIQGSAAGDVQKPGTSEWKADSAGITADIELQEWKPNAEYLEQLKKTTPQHYYNTYLRLKPKYKDQPAFYADIARFLYTQGDKPLALQVLSNIAELKLEDAELLRILGHQLAEWNEKELAKETFTDVLDMRGEDPQSRRDLALANEAAGNYQEATDGLYYLLTHSWDARFDKMTSVVINEFNAIISAHKGSLNTSAYDARFIYDMPVDVRIVITWTSNDSDIDLWVSDPLNEKCDYTFPLTKGGGRLSGDITQGFGPEEYCMKKAVNGSYTVEINYYGDSRQTLAGPITVKAELYTHYGTPQQKKQVINLRLTSEKEVIKLGVLKF
jgi:hypothetical protein